MTSLAVLVSCVLFTLCCHKGCNADEGKAEIEILGISSCADPAPDYEFTFELKDGDDGKALYGTYKFPEDLSDDFKFDLHVDKKAGEIWEKNFIVLEKADLCTYVQRYAGPAYLKAAKEAEPQMNEDCPVTAGSFKLDHFQLSSDDCSPPKIMGHFMIEAKFYDPDEQQITCHTIEAVLK